MKGRSRPAERGRAYLNTGEKWETLEVKNAARKEMMEGLEERKTLEYWRFQSSTEPTRGKSYSGGLGAQNGLNEYILSFRDHNPL